jgi:hypothetical protein
MIRTTLRVAAGLALVAAPAAAQSWQTIGTPSNSGTGAYWNNVSDDNNNTATDPAPACNVGAILTNTPALSAGFCNNQGPVYIPLNPAPLTTQDVFLGGMGGSNPGGFRFAAGNYSFSLLGRVAGDQSTAWGIITDGGSVFTAAQLSSPLVISENFAIWISAALPQSANGQRFLSTQQQGVGAIANRSATNNQQFAVFTRNFGQRGPSTDAFGAILTGQIGQTFFVGMEDNVNGGRGFGGNLGAPVSDRDYNDILIGVQAVPEPSTYALMATGLAGLAAMARRRRKA